MLSLSILNADLDGHTMKRKKASGGLKAEIAKRAYELWEAEGRVHGHDLAHWFKVEREMFEKSRKSDPVRIPNSLSIISDETKRPLKVTFLHSLSSKPLGVPCSTHYGLSAGMIADRIKKLEAPSVRENPLLLKKYEMELAGWTECYQNTWHAACKELAHCFKNVGAFLALPSNRANVRNTLIACFSSVHPGSIDLSAFLGKPEGVRFGCFDDVKSIIEQLIVNQSLLDSVAKVSDLLLIDDWIGTGRTMFAVQAKLATLLGKDLASQCAVPGVARDEDSIKQNKAIESILAEIKHSAQIQAPPD